jgi:hypothetical protein
MAISKLTGVFSAEQEAMDAIKNASQYALELFMACAALYLGRKLQRNEKGALNIDDDSKKSD